MKKIKKIKRNPTFFKKLLFLKDTEFILDD